MLTLLFLCVIIIVRKHNLTKGGIDGDFLYCVLGRSAFLFWGGFLNFWIKYPLKIVHMHAGLGFARYLRAFVL